MVQKKAGTGVKDKALYKRLRNLGVSTKESARVANTSAKTSRKKASQRGGAATSYANLKVPGAAAQGQEGWHQRPVNHEQEAARKGAARRLRAPAIPHPADSGFLAVPSLAGPSSPDEDRVTN